MKKCKLCGFKQEINIHSMKHGRKHNKFQKINLCLNCELIIHDICRNECLNGWKNEENKNKWGRCNTIQFHKCYDDCRNWKQYITAI